MPSWRVHLTVGFILTGALFYGAYFLGILDYITSGYEFQFLYWIHLPFVTLLGSLAPDFDSGKTRIRYSLGPLLGIMVIFSYLYINASDITSIDPIFILTLLVLFIIVPLTAGFVIPFKHHGRLHSVSFGLLFA